MVGEPSRLHQLTPNEVMFVGGETPTVYQHTGSLVLLDAGSCAAFDAASLRARLEERLGRVPNLRWRLHEVPLGLDLPYWVEDEDFDFDNHIHRIAAPAPGDRETLGELASYLYARHLDRSRPLWEVWIIEGLGEDRYGLFLKLHHAMLDGEGAARLGEVMCDLAPDSPPPAIDPAIAEARPGEVPDWWRESVTAFGRLAGMPMRAGLELLDRTRHAVTHRASGTPSPGAAAPRTALNGTIGRDRGYVFGSVSLEGVKTVKDHFGVTVNDVVLALVSDTVRSYLLERGELPGQSLRTEIAVSLRNHEDDDFSNHVTAIGVTLATDLADPVERLRTIAAGTASAKADARGGAKGFLEAVSILPPALLNLAVSLAPPEVVRRVAGINLIVSSIRGSPVPLYLAGARITEVYPMSIIMSGGGLNITCMSYADEIGFGLTTAPELLPEPWTIVDGLDRALSSYLECVGSGEPRRTERT